MAGSSITLSGDSAGRRRRGDELDRVALVAARVGGVSSSETAALTRVAPGGNEMLEPIAQTSPRGLARMAGLFFLLTIIAGIFAQGFISERLIVSGDATATAANILAHRGLYTLGFTVYMVEMACQIVMTVLFYRLLRPVNRTVALASMALSLTGCVIKTFGRVFYLAPLFLLGNTGSPPYLGVFSTEQVQALSLVLLGVNDRAAAMGLAFFGFSDALQGLLIFASTFLPRWLGALSFVAALGWMTFVYPPLGYALFLYLAGFGLVVSIVMIFWLLVRGVDERRWKEQDAASRS
jgi:hypothetical protein